MNMCLSVTLDTFVCVCLRTIMFRDWFDVPVILVSLSVDGV